MLDVVGVYAGYVEGIDVLRDVTLSAEDGRVTVIIGPNGSGKSTVLKTICGLLKPRRGRITYYGEDITMGDPEDLPKLGIAYIPQDRSIFPYLTVERNLKLGLWSKRGDKELINQRLREVLERFPELRARLNQLAGDLSGGQQRMLELARGMMLKPRMIIVDEPTIGLSPILSKEFYRKLDELKREGITILLVDQNVRLAVQIADYVYVMDSGRIARHGERGEIEPELREIVASWLRY